MLRPEAALRAQVPSVQPTRALASSGGGSFSPLFREVSAEVGRFIEQGAAGAGDSVVAAATLSFEGRLLRESMRTPGAHGAASASSAGAFTSSIDSSQRRDFIAGIRPWAEQAAGRLGVSPDLVIAHAALESGWGGKPIRSPEGADSHNLFGIKAGGARASGEVSVRTTEHIDGEDQSVIAAFRSYPDTASAFRDYLRLLLDNPRYAGALNAGGDARAFADGLARGGYATDPAYADKLVRLAAQVRAGGY